MSSLRGRKGRRVKVRVKVIKEIWRSSAGCKCDVERRILSEEDGRTWAVMAVVDGRRLASHPPSPNNTRER